MKPVKSLSVRTLIMMVSTILLNAIAIITAPIFTRILTTADFGIYSLYLSWVVILSNVFGMQTGGTLNNAKVEFSDKEYKVYCVNCFLISVIGILILGCLILIFGAYVTEWTGIPKGCLIWLVIGIYGTYMVGFLNGFLVIEKKVVQNLIISFVVTLIITVGSIILILHSTLDGFYARILVYGSVYLIAGLVISFYFFNFRCLSINLSYWKYCLQLSLPLVVHSLSGSILDQSDRIMLMPFKGEETVGIYSFSYTMAYPICVLAGAINSAWMPEYYELMKEKKILEIKKHYNRQLFLMTGICCGYMLVSPEILKILAAKEYWEGVGIIPLVIIGYFFNFLYFLPVNYEFYNKQTKFIAICTIGAAIMNIVLNAILIPSYGMYGAATATLGAYIILFVVHDFIAKRIVKGYDIKWSFYFKGIIPILLIVFVNIRFSDNIIIRWTLGGIIGIAIILNLKKQKALI